MKLSNKTFSIKKTALYNWHLGKGGKITNYNNWKLPLHYESSSVLSSVVHTRKKATVFDVSHMLQLEIKGKDRNSFLESLIVGDVDSLKVGDARLSLFTTPQGTIIDDLIFSNTKDSLYLVCNAGCAEKDLNHLNQHLNQNKQTFKDVEIINLSERKSLISIQGPYAHKIIRNGMGVSENCMNTIKFMSSSNYEIFGKEARITRCGYTGEDGFEIRINHEDAEHVMDNLVGDETDVLPAGLGARDILRLEAGYCLYGNDIDEKTTPVQAGLSWTIPKSRRNPESLIKFPGWDVVMDQIKNKTHKTKRVGFVTNSKRPPRNGLDILKDGETVGKVTSSAYSPNLLQGIGMGYIQKDVNSDLYIEIKGQRMDIELKKMPFIKV